MIASRERIVSLERNREHIKDQINNAQNENKM
jgi:hypothetical protein